MTDFDELTLAAADDFLPPAFAARMKEMLGDDYPAYIASYAKPRRPSLRVNPLKFGTTEPEAVRAALPFPLSPVPWVSGGYYYPDDESVRPGRHILHEAGAYYIQEASAMIPASLCPPAPGIRVLDLCAAPGGKTTQAAGAMGGQGLLVANEIVPNRAAILSQNVERMGISNALVTNESPAALAKRFPGFFDLIIVDAPCSGEGMFRKEEQALTMWSRDNVDACAARQKEILTEADKMLSPGGALIYSTCTFAPEEDEGMLAWFLSAHPGYTVEVPHNPAVLSCLADGTLDGGQPAWVKDVPVTDNLAAQIRGSIRLFPHHGDGEGHFAVLLRKAGEASAPAYTAERKKNTGKSGKGKKETSPVEKALALFSDFARETLKTIPAGIPCLFGDNLWLLPEGCGLDAESLSGLHVLRAGLQLGSVKGGRFEPSHALALSSKAEDARNVFPLDTDAGQDATWLRGEVIPCGAELKSWHLVTAYGLPVGWGKASGGMMKNHYPKGLRKP